MLIKIASRNSCLFLQEELLKILVFYRYLSFIQLSDTRGVSG